MQKYLSVFFICVSFIFTQHAFAVTSASQTISATLSRGEGGGSDGPGQHLGVAGHEEAAQAGHGQGAQGGIFGGEVGRRSGRRGDYGRRYADSDDRAGQFLASHRCDGAAEGFHNLGVGQRAVRA